jgi:hypothetical protein
LKYDLELTSSKADIYSYSTENLMASALNVFIGYDGLGQLLLVYDGGLTYFQYNGDVAVREISTTASSAATSPASTNPYYGTKAPASPISATSTPTNVVALPHYPTRAAP